MTHFRSRCVLLTAALLTATFIPAGCRDQSKPATSSAKVGAAPGRAPTVPAAIKVTLLPVERRALERTVEITGTLYGQEEATISAKVPGRLVEIVHDLGDVVLPGQTLARIDPRDFELAVAERRALAAASLAKVGLTSMPAAAFDASRVPTVERARAEASNAEAKLERAARLFEQSPPLISAQDYADIQTARDVARSQSEVEMLTARAVLAEAHAQQAAVDQAEQRLRDADITAPQSTSDTDTPPTAESSPSQRRYRVAERLVSVGEYVTEGRGLFKLVSSDIIKLRAQAPERFSGTIQPGQSASIITDSSLHPLQGRVTRVSPAVDPTSRAFTVEIEVVNHENVLKPGAFARGRIVTRVDEGVLLAPGAAVVSFAGVQRVFSVKDGKVVEHRVRLGEQVGESVEIIGDLPVSQLINATTPGLVSGMSVDPQPGAGAPRQ